MIMQQSADAERAEAFRNGVCCNDEMKSGGFFLNRLPMRIHGKDIKFLANIPVL
jgi:hypothetical protein